MSEANKLALLRDLALLIRKYGPEAFSDLASLLRSPQGAADLIAILESAESAGRKSGVPKSGTKTRGGEASRTSMLDFLARLAKGDAQKAELLSGLCEALMAKKALPTLREIRSFAHDNGLKIIAATSRDKAISPFIRDLSSRSVEEIQSMLTRVRMIDHAAGDRSLEGWTGVILNKERSRGNS